MRHETQEQWRASKAIIADESYDFDNVCLHNQCLYAAITCT